ncbi:MAG: disulfide bond formation protein B [Hyphomicrobiaceae bacterium]
MALKPTSPTADSAYKAGALALALALASILAAHGFERFGGYAPCELCLLQRWAYYGGMPALFLSLVLTTMGHGKAAGFLFFAVALAFLANAGLGVYHSGVEWKFWPGPDTCSGPVGTLGSGTGGVLNDLGRTRVMRCDEAPWRLLGLSFAGWNVVTSFLIFTAALQAAFAALRR